VPVEQDLIVQVVAPRLSSRGRPVPGRLFIPEHQLTADEARALAEKLRVGADRLERAEDVILPLLDQVTQAYERLYDEP
jgi:hypothetical protein